MAGRPIHGLAGGLALAGALPLVYAALANLIAAGIVELERSSILFGVIGNLGLSVLVQLVLALFGVRLAGVAIGLRHPLAWFALSVALIVPSGFAWFMGYAMFGGAMGSPF